MKGHEDCSNCLETVKDAFKEVQQLNIVIKGREVFEHTNIEGIEIHQDNTITIIITLQLPEVGGEYNILADLSVKHENDSWRLFLGDDILEEGKFVGIDVEKQLFILH